MFAVVVFLHVVRGDHFIIADTDNDRLQLCDAASPGGGPCETVASVVRPVAVTVDNAGDYLVATGHEIKRCPSASPGAECETVVGFEDSGDGAIELNWPRGVFWDPWRYYVIADTRNNRVQRCVAGILHARCDTVTDGLTLALCGGHGRLRELHHLRHRQPPHSSLRCGRTKSSLPDRGGIWLSIF